MGSEIMNSETLRKAQQNTHMNYLRSIQGMQDIAFPRVQFSNIFLGEHAPELHYIIRAFEADSPLVSPVTLVLNVQLQKTPYLVKTIPSDMIPI